MIWLLTAALAGQPTVHASLDAFDAWLDDASDAWHDEASWASTTEPRRAAAVEAIVRLAGDIDTCADLDDTAAALAVAQLGLTVHDVGTQRFVVVEDLADDGAGWSVFRCGPATPMLLSAPHSFFDLKTGVVARRAFLHGNARGAFFNTVHRYRAEPGEAPEDELHPADVTRQPAALLHTRTLAWLAARPETRVLQVHGFGAGRARAPIVVSNGTEHAPPKRARTALSNALDVPAHAYGDDTRRLGARHNVLGRALASAPWRFLHLELSRDLRERLATDTEQAARLVTVLLEVPWDR